MSSSALQHISTKDAPGNPSIYSQAVVVGNFVYCSGSIGIDAVTVPSGRQRSVFMQPLTSR